MKKVLNVLFIISFLFLGTDTLLADDNLSPADIYYRDNIAVNDVSAKAPSTFDDEEEDPGGGPPSSGTGGGEFVGGPLEDAVLPIVVAGFAYAVFILNKKRLKKTA